VLTKEMIGIKPDFNKLVFEPRFPACWNEVSVIRNFRGKSFEIKIKRKKVDEITLNLNGKVIQGNQIYLDQCKLTNEVKVYIPKIMKH
jgi:cellobiose phosphorylase